MNGRPRVIVFDSGTGGLTVPEQVHALRPDADFIHAADDAAFPYGGPAEERLAARILDVAGMPIGRFDPDVLVVARDTAGTPAPGHPREAFDLPFAGAVPAIDPAPAIARRVTHFIGASGNGGRAAGSGGPAVLAGGGNATPGLGRVPETYGIGAIGTNVPVNAARSGPPDSV